MIQFHFDWNLSSSCKAAIFIFVVLAIIFIILGIRFSKLDPEKDEVPTKGIMMLSVIIVEMANNMAVTNVNEKEKRFFGPYVVTIGSYLTFANLASLLGLTPPMANVGVALSMSLLAFIILQVYAFKYQGLKNRINGLLGPVKGVSFLVLPISLVSELTTPISLGMRLFGNIFSGVVIGALVIGAAEMLGTWVGGIVATAFTAILVHTIFDIAFGLIQMFVYTMLTLMLTKQNMSTD